MSHFRDLDLLDYHQGPLDSAAWAVPLRAVGWLDALHPFPTGAPADRFVARFEELVAQTGQAFAQYAFRGLHCCDLCPPDPPLPIAQSHINVLVPGDGEVFAATAGLLHYVRVHRYRPPAAFVDAVLACPSCDDAAYLEALHDANACVAPPLETWTAYLARGREESASAQRFRDALGRRIEQASRAQVLAAARLAWPGRDVVDGRGGIVLGRLVARFDAAGRFLAFDHD
jgi:hypothetical protein